ncbi:hypothetical protein [Salinimonas profundi]|uniref:hypothetical protein n=1 Tax=Salinimonas profundi TaxID=2729140 RepID=UPI001CC2B9FE|nr:hypothetical protein [Salinimonas profundi]
MKMKRAVCTALTLAALTPWVSAVEVVDGQYVWRFNSQQAWPSGYDRLPVSLTLSLTLIIIRMRSFSELPMRCLKVS